MNEEKSTTHTSQEEKQSNYDYSKENELIEGTPLWIIKTNEDGTEWVLSYGRYCLKKGKDKEELKEYVDNNLLNVITNMIICTIEESKKTETKLDNI